MFAEVRPTLLIECGTNRGGSFLFFAALKGRSMEINVGPQFNTAEEFWSSGTTIIYKSSIDKSNSSEFAGSTK
jgi:cephalosporin hydroxylase